MDENTIRQIVRDEIAKNKQQSQYSVNRVPVHAHNGIDSPNLDPHSVNGFVGLPSNSTPAASAGVLGLLGQQTVNGPPDTNASFNPPTVVVYPIPIIYGFGVGDQSAFNGGEAPQGTVLFFDNNGVNLLSYLYIKTLDGWAQIAVTSFI